MREITTHRTNDANKQLTVVAIDEPGSGGANHVYGVGGASITKNPGVVLGIDYIVGGGSLALLFQNGPIKEVGVNGLTHEALLAILIDRLESFQQGPFANEYNGRALAFLRAGLEELQARTKERESRGVEGTHAV